MNFQNFYDIRLVFQCKFNSFIQIFMKILKQSFSIFYIFRHDNHGSILFFLSCINHDYVFKNHRPWLKTRYNHGTGRIISFLTIILYSVGMQGGRIKF